MQQPYQLYQETPTGAGSSSSSSSDYGQSDPGGPPRYPAASAPPANSSLNNVVGDKTELNSVAGGKITLLPNGFVIIRGWFNNEVSWSFVGSFLKLLPANFRDVRELALDARSITSVEVQCVPVSSRERTRGGTLLLVAWYILLLIVALIAVGLVVAQSQDASYFGIVTALSVLLLFSVVGYVVAVVSSRQQEMDSVPEPQPVLLVASLLIIVVIFITAVYSQAAINRCWKTSDSPSNGSNRAVNQFFDAVMCKGANQARLGERDFHTMAKDCLSSLCEKPVEDSARGPWIAATLLLPVWIAQVLLVSLRTLMPYRHFTGFKNRVLFATTAWPPSVGYAQVWWDDSAAVDVTRLTHFVQHYRQETAIPERQF